MLFTEDEAHELTRKLLALGKADETHVSVAASRTTNQRFARTAPTTDGERDDVSINVTSVYGKKSGSASVNQRDAASLEAVVRRAEDAAQRAPEDPEAMPGLPAQTYLSIPQAFDADTAEHGGDALVDGVSRAIAIAKDAGLVGAGYVEVSAWSSAIASSLGVFGFHRATLATMTQTFRTKDAKGSGWGQSVATRIGDLDFVGAAKTAATKARASADTRPLDPGSYAVVLEPSVVNDLLSLMMGSLDQREADEGRSFFSKAGGGTRIGETLFPSTITIKSDPMDPTVPGGPWGGEELPEGAVTWIDQGKLAQLACSRYWAGKQGRSPLPGPANVIMAGGSGGIDDLIAKTERGVLITSVWYIRTVDPQTLLHTGLTRDGTFWIEDGKIAHGVNNFRWNDSPIQVLSNVTAMSTPMRALSREDLNSTTLVPALAVKAFELSSVSDAV